MYHRLLAPALAGALLLAAACSDDDDGDATIGGVSAGNGDSEAGGDGQPIDANVDHGNPIATVTSDVERGLSGEDGERIPVRLDIVRFERNGELVELEYVLTNEHDVNDIQPYSTWLGYLNEAKLVDQENQRVFLPAQDSEGECLCSTSQFTLGPGESTERYVTFAGLPEDLAEVDVHFYEFTPIDGVPISG